MWQYFIYALCFILGWYLYPFDSRVRSSINALIVRLVGGIVSAIQNRQETPTKKRTVRTTQPVQKAPKQDNAVFSNGKLCSKCKDTVLMPLGGEYKGFGFCPNCKGMETAR